MRVSEDVGIFFVVMVMLFNIVMALASVAAATWVVVTVLRAMDVAV